MCAGAIVAARVARVVYGCGDPKGGGAGGVVDLLRHPALNHRVDVVSGVLADVTAAQLRAFFAERRSTRRTALPDALEKGSRPMRAISLLPRAAWWNRLRRGGRVVEGTRLESGQTC